MTRHPSRDEPAAAEGDRRRPGAPTDAGADTLRTWRGAAVAALLLACFGLLATPLFDGDFFWHAATGRWIWQAGSLPRHDPFGVYLTDDLRTRVGLQSYWLSQVALGLGLRLAGPTGIVLLKSILLTGVLLLAYRRARRLAVEPAVAIAVVALAGVALRPFTGERPQLFSFALAALALWILDAHRGDRDSRRLLWLIPVMALWANCHGAVTLGGALLALAGACATLEWLAAGAQRERLPRVLLLSLAVAFAATLLSPVGADIYQVVWRFEGSELQRRTSEYQSPLVLALRHGMPMPAFWALAGLSGLALPRLLRRGTLWEAACLGALLGLSLRAARYAPFFLLLATPYLAQGLCLWPAIRTPARRLARPLLAGLAVVSLGALLWGMLRGQAFGRGLRPGAFPEAAADAIRAQGLAGRAFNSLDWGGYLLWQSYPAVRPFIDGRNLDLRVLDEYTHMLWLTPRGVGLLESHGFALALVAHRNRLTGEAYPLVPYLRRHPGWRLVREDAVGALFAKAQSQQP